MNQDKAIKKLGVETVSEMDAMKEETLKSVIVEASEAMRSAKEELEANPIYVELKENLKALTAGKRDLDSRQNARIQYALELIQGFGK